MADAFLSHNLAPHLASVGQALEAFNAAVGRCEAFKLADIEMFMVVGFKMSRGIKVVLGEGGEPDESLSEQDYSRIIQAAELTPAESLWSTRLAGLWQSVHLNHIGSMANPALHRHLTELASKFELEYGVG